MKTLHWIPRAGLALVLAIGASAPAQAAGEFTRDFGIERCTFASSGRENPYFSLNPGDQSTLEGEEDGEAVKVQITVKNGTKDITFKTPGGRTMTVRARIVEEREWQDDELVEVSRNWFARCLQTNDIFYFGESVDIYENGQVVGHDGSWRAGLFGAQPGIFMPARFLLGARYFQEIAFGVALDRSENVQMGLSVTAAGETFRDCVRTVETTPLEPGSEGIKVYCPGIGLVVDNVVTLTEFKRD